MRWFAVVMLASCHYISPGGSAGDDTDAPLGADAGGDSTAVSCPAGFETFGASQYLIQNNSDEIKTWKSAESVCETFGTGVHLAVLETVPEADLLTMHTSGGRDYWVGMVQPDGQAMKKDGWIWITGAPAIDHWGFKQPDDGDNPQTPFMTPEDDTDQFAALSGGGGNGTLDDARESSSKFWICECDGKRLDPDIDIP